MSQLHDAIAKYLTYGWNLVPIKPRSKVPAVEWAGLIKSPMLDFSGVPEDSNLAVICGSVSGIVVLDVDGKVGLNFVKTMN